MQFQVPQFIETEDKIVGPLSLRQFIYIAVAGGLSAGLYFSIGGVVWVIGSLIIFAAAIALAFVKIEGRSFLNIVSSAANFYWKPQTYVWQPNHPIATIPRAKPVKISKPEKKPLSTIMEKLASGSALHSTLVKLQTAEHGKESDRQFLEHKMEARYQIFRRETGEKRAAKRIDYR